ncbi:MarR family winged helix-turn-helix transcriptional regulator [Marmoricola sp. RAF53]|uniref:MarR family winged helix-turn-helix transcriptional regulator n=1 Tax=Marmoricola sp. RAF53 TaxID=3233059 RepID=UPI003F96F509
MTPEHPEDAVDRIVRQWAVERPELDTGPMAVIGRIHRVADLLEAALRPPFAAEGLGNGDFDVLASLRRAGAPYRLSATDLTATMMVTSGAVTKRVDRLEAAGLVTREVAKHDARGRLIGLTPAGLAVVDRVVEKHWANEERLLAPLGAGERAALVASLRKLLLALEGR